MCTCIRVCFRAQRTARPAGRRFLCVFWICVCIYARVCLCLFVRVYASLLFFSHESPSIFLPFNSLPRSPQCVQYGLRRWWEHRCCSTSFLTGRKRYICINIFMYTYLYINICTCIYIYIYTCTNTCIFSYTYIFISMYVYV